MTRYFASDPTELGLSVSAMVWRERASAGGIEGGADRGAKSGARSAAADGSAGERWAGRELLLMQRADNGHWGLPGGFVELGESVEQAARREVAEETGWQVEIGRLIGVYSDPLTQVVDYGRRRGEGPGGGDRRVQIVNLCFEARAIAPGRPTTPEETLQMAFFPPQALPAPFVPIHAVRIEDGLAARAEAAVR